LRATIAKIKKAPIALSPEAKALWANKLKIAVDIARIAILIAVANVPLKILLTVLPLPYYCRRL